MDEMTARGEIESLHQYFVDWFGGLIERDDTVFEERFARRFGAECELTRPSPRYHA
ncbi:MAG: hypothetical protein ACU84Q_14640 [Gammaproteobacteria bacterium]